MDGWCHGRKPSIRCRPKRGPDLALESAEHLSGDLGLRTGLPPTTEDCGPPERGCKPCQLSYVIGQELNSLIVGCEARRFRREIIRRSERPDVLALTL